jgi:hypothetical protein
MISARTQISTALNLSDVRDGRLAALVTDLYGRRHEAAAAPGGGGEPGAFEALREMAREVLNRNEFGGAYRYADPRPSLSVLADNKVRAAILSRTHLGHTERESWRARFEVQCALLGHACANDDLDQAKVLLSEVQASWQGGDVGRFDAALHGLMRYMAAGNDSVQVWQWLEEQRPDGDALEIDCTVLGSVGQALRLSGSVSAPGGSHGATYTPESATTTLAILAALRGPRAEVLRMILDRRPDWMSALRVLDDSGVWSRTRIRPLSLALLGGCRAALPVLLEFHERLGLRACSEDLSRAFRHGVDFGGRTKDVLPDHFLLALINSIPDLNECDASGVSPLTHAVEMNRADLVRALCERGADPDMVSRTTMRYNAFIGQVPSDAVSPMIHAARCGYAESIDALVACGARVNSPGKDGRTALHHACRACSVPAAAALLRGGADPVCVDHAGAMPIDLTRQVARDGLEALLGAHRNRGAMLSVVGRVRAARAGAGSAAAA